MISERTLEIIYEFGIKFVFFLVIGLSVSLLATGKKRGGETK
jgi:hypothetical protein